jgi:hypothetical protein
MIGGIFISNLNSQNSLKILKIKILGNCKTMKKVTKCVIPAAGMGTRFLPIVDKPVMQYLVEEAIAAGCTDIIIIT